MKLCIISSGDFFSTYGGGQVYVKNLVDEIIRLKEPLNITISIISFSSGFPAIAVGKEYYGIPIYELNSEGNIAELFSMLKPDIVHAHGEKLRVAKLCSNLGIKCVITAHHGGLVCPAGTLLNTKDEICNISADYTHCLKCYLRNTPTGFCWYPLFKHLNRNFFIRIGQRLKKKQFIPYISPIGETGLIVNEKLNNWLELKETATHFIAPSKAMAEALQRNGCPINKITVIPHGIPLPPNINSQFSTLNSQLLVFYYVGRINYVKGIHILLQVFHSIENPNIELHLIGGAGNRKEERYNKQLKRKYRNDRRIVWHGKMPFEEMNDLVMNYHCLIHPAIYLEVFGLNISEALAQHKYVIASRCGGAEMQIHNENEGMLIEPNDSIALKNAILKYIAAPKESQATVINIQTHFQELYNLYKKLLTIKN